MTHEKGTISLKSARQIARLSQEAVEAIVANIAASAREFSSADEFTISEAQAVEAVRTAATYFRSL